MTWFAHCLLFNTVHINELEKYTGTWILHTIFIYFQTVLQESKTQEKLANSKTIKPTTVKDDVIDLVSEDGEGGEDECEDWKLRENKENQGIFTPGKSVPDRDGGGEMSTPRNQRSSLQSMFSPSPKQMGIAAILSYQYFVPFYNNSLYECFFDFWSF